MPGFTSKMRLALAAAACLAAALAGCGGSDPVPPATNTLVATTATYQVVYDPGTSTAKEGKTAFTIRVTNRSTGDNVAGASVAIVPLMHMTSMNHTTPVDNVVVDAGNGVYTGTAYFLMPTMGSEYWELKLVVNGETATFTPTVAMAMAGNTVRTTLKGQDDNVATMTGQVARSYYLFRDKLVGTSTFGVFLAANDNSMSMPQLQAGTLLHDASGTPWAVDNVAVRVSTDNGATWADGTNTSGAHWEFTGLTGLSSGTAGHVLVELSVNGEQKTTDGAAPSGANGYADFTVTPM